MVTCTPETLDGSTGRATYFLVGRKGDIFKTSTGRRILATGIESRLLASGLFDHAIVCGENRARLSAIVTMDLARLLPAHSAGPIGTQSKVLPHDGLPARTSELVVRAVKNVNSTVPAYERISGVLVVSRPFSLEGGELTSSQKLRRARVPRTTSARSMAYMIWLKSERPLDLIAERGISVAFAARGQRTGNLTPWKYLSLEG